MLNKLFTKCFFAKPTTFYGDKSLVLNFDDDSKKLVVINLSKYSSYHFYIQEENKKKYVLCFEGIINGETEVIKIGDFDDDDDAEKAMQQVLVSLNGKTKTMLKITVNLISIIVILYALLTLASSVLGFMAPQKNEIAANQPQVSAIPPFSYGQTGQAAWGLSPAQQAELAKIQMGIPMGFDPNVEAAKQQQYQQKMAEANKLMNANLNAMRNNRDALVDGGSPYLKPDEVTQALNNNNPPSSGQALINALQGK